MDSMLNLFSRHGLKSLLQKFWSAVKPSTQKKYLNQLEKKVDDAIEKNAKKIQKINAKKERKLQRELNAVRKRQAKLEKERKQQEMRFKKLKKEQDLKSRLLSDDERLSLLNRIDNEPLSTRQVNEIQQKIKNDKLERIRRKKQLRKQGKDIRDTKRRKKLSEKYDNLNKVLGQTSVREGDKTLGNGIIQSLIIKPKNGVGILFEDFLELVKRDVIRIMGENNQSKKIIAKVFYENVKYRYLGEGIADRADKDVSSKPIEIFLGTNLSQTYENIRTQLNNAYIEEKMKGSGWVLHQIYHMEIIIMNYTPMSNVNDGIQPPLNITQDDAGGGFFNIGKHWTDKKAVIIPQNDETDPFCALYAIDICLHKPENNPGRISEELRQRIKEYNMVGISFPLKVSDLSKIEEQNGLKIFALGVSTNRKRIDIIKSCDAPYPNVILVLFKNPQGKCHWGALPNMKSLSRFVSSTISRHHGTRLVCTNCIMNSFRTRKALEKHQEICCLNKPQVVELPWQDNERVIEFKNFHKMMRSPICLYADFECYQPRTYRKQGKNSFYHSTHVPSGYGLYLRSDNDEKLKSEYFNETFDGNVAKAFVQKCIEIRDKCDSLTAEDMIFTEEDELKYNLSTKCWICDKQFSDDDDDIKVRDHCHFTGKFRGAAHSSCNLKLKEKRFIPVVFHNLKKYDAHLFMRAFAELEEKPHCIPQNAENFISFSLKKKGSSEIRFIDSYAHLSYSLSDMVKTLKEFPMMGKVFSPDVVKLLCRKGVFPYEWFDRFSKLYKVKLPPQNSFYSNLNGCGIKYNDYLFASLMFNKFCTNVKDYHDLYLKTDVMLLADVFEAYRTLGQNSFGLDPLNYYTSPGFGWDSVLKYSGVKLDTLQKEDMYIFMEKGIRGGYSNCHKRYAKANHKYMTHYVKGKDCVYIMYWDINSQYPTVMVLPMPVRNFEWMTRDELDNIFELYKQKRYDEIPPCTISVDLEHDPKNFDKEKIFTMCPEVFEEKGVKKLSHTLYSKEGYVIHHRALKYYLKHGMILRGVNCGIKYEEEAWMKGYIEYCVEQRKKADKEKNKFLSDFWKLMMNSVFGKTMENIRKRIDFKLVNDSVSLQKWINKPFLKDISTYVKGTKDDPENFLVGLHMSKPKIKLNMPIYTGQAILDTSKIEMYKFIYDFCFKKWPGKFEVLQTDTDSVICQIWTEDLPADIAPHIPEKFDTSKMMRLKFDETIFPKVNQKVLGMMKDELGGMPITEFVGVGPKNYSFKFEKENGKVDFKSTCKGVSNTPEFDEYKRRIVDGGDDIRKTCFRIGSKNHILSTIECEKVAITGDLRKRVYDPEDKYKTLPLGTDEFLKTPFLASERYP